MADRRETTSDGMRLSYLVEGDGPVVVLLPAWMMTAGWFLDDGYVAALAADHRVIAVDPLGSGRSDRPLELEAYSDERLVEHLAAVLSAEGVDHCVLWGISRGATIAQLYARRRPRQVSLVVYVNEFLGADRSDYGRVAIDVFGANDALVAALEAGDWREVWGLVPAPPAPLTARVERDNDPWVLAAVLRAGRARAQGFLPSAVPTLAVWGSDEPYADLNDDLAEALPIETAVLVGDRYETYLAVDRQMAVARPHLERAHARRA